MSNFFHELAFHRSGKPRKWLIFVLFGSGTEGRPMFRRFVYKKSGRMRAQYAYWVKPQVAQTETTGTSLEATPEFPSRILPQEAALQAMLPLEETVKNWRGKPVPTDLLSVETLLPHLAPQSAAPPGRLVIAVSHDDYLKVPGGVQFCIQREETLAVAAGMRYLQIHPWHALPRLAHLDKDPDTIVALILNGTTIGACRISTLIDVTRQLGAAGDISVVVHHLLGHLPERIADLVQATGSDACVFWLHDFFSLCASYSLQRNNVAFCAAPPLGSNACTLCVYGAERTTHQARMQRFFQTLAVDVASPSEVTAEFWQAKSGLKVASLRVLPHMTLDVAPREPAVRNPADRPVTVGYLGSPAPHKGWSVFIDLLQQHGESRECRFVVMSRKRPRIGEHGWVGVHVTAANPTAMSDAVASEDVDIVLHWPTWPETFSFTTFEAMAGSAYVVTNAGSGNVAAVVKQTGRGAILGSEAELQAFFRNGQAADLAARRRAAARNTKIVTRHSEMSLPLLRKD